MGCPNLINGQCIGPDEARCDPGFKLDDAKNCTLYSCVTATEECRLSDGSSGATCNVEFDTCVCSDVTKYYDHTNKMCVDGCTGLVGGIALGRILPRVTLVGLQMETLFVLSTIAQPYQRETRPSAVALPLQPVTLPRSSVFARTSGSITTRR